MTDLQNRVDSLIVEKQELLDRITVIDTEREFCVNRLEKINIALNMLGLDTETNIPAVPEIDVPGKPEQTSLFDNKKKYKDKDEEYEDRLKFDESIQFIDSVLRKYGFKVILREHGLEIGVLTCSGTLIKIADKEITRTEIDILFDILANGFGRKEDATRGAFVLGTARFVHDRINDSDKQEFIEYLKKNTTAKYIMDEFEYERNAEGKKCIVLNKFVTRYLNFLYMSMKKGK